LGLNYDEIEKIVSDISSAFLTDKPNISFEASKIPAGASAAYDPKTRTMYIKPGKVSVRDVAHEMAHHVHTYYGVNITREEAEAFAKVIEEWYARRAEEGYSYATTYGSMFRGYTQQIAVEVPAYVSEFTHVEKAFHGELFTEANPLCSFKARVKGGYRYIVRLIEVDTGYKIFEHEWYQDLDGEVEFNEPYLGDLRMPDYDWNLRFELWVGYDFAYEDLIYSAEFTVNLADMFRVKVPFEGVTVVALPTDISKVMLGEKHVAVSGEELYAELPIRGEYFIYCYIDDWFGWKTKVAAEPGGSIYIPMKYYREEPQFKIDFYFANPIGADLFKLITETVGGVFAEYIYQVELISVTKPNPTTVRIVFKFKRGSPLAFAVLDKIIIALVIALALIGLIGYTFGPYMPEIVDIAKIMAYASIIGAVTGLILAVRGEKSE